MLRTQLDEQRAHDFAAFLDQREAWQAKLCAMQSLRAFPCENGEVLEAHAERLTDGVCWSILFEQWN